MDLQVLSSNTDSKQKLQHQGEHSFHRNWLNFVSYSCRHDTFFLLYTFVIFDKVKKESKNEAQHCLNAISGKKLEYPVYYDIEQKEILAKGRSFCSAIATNFCSFMESNKKFCGIYASKSYFDSYFNDKVKKDYSIWVAQYNSRCTYTGSYGMWQRSSKGSVSGISGNVDLDVSYQNFPEIIKKAHLNGF